MAPAHSSSFGPYQLTRTLGEGEFGKVKLAIHQTSRKSVAIKLIRKDSFKLPQRHAKLLREIKILKMVNHPHIVKLIEVIETPTFIGVIMEYASGGELFEHILARKYLKETEARHFFAQLLMGVAYIHSKNIVHRDLKLENLLLDSNRNVIITDFGFANISSPSKNSILMTSCGSPCYAAPELVINDGYVGESADIWSCGVILYAMLCGYLPFDDDPANPDGENITRLYKYILETKLEFPDHVSHAAKQLLNSILVPDPNNRATLAEIIEHPWLKPCRHYFFQFDENADNVNNSVDKKEIEKQDSGKSIETIVDLRGKSLDIRRDVKDHTAVYSNGISDMSKSVTNLQILNQIPDSITCTNSEIQTSPHVSVPPRSNSPSLIPSLSSIKYHHGPIDQRALTSKHPWQMVKELVIEFKKRDMIVSSTEFPYRIKVIQQNSKSNNELKKEKIPSLGTLISTFPLSLMKKVKYMATFGSSYNSGFDGSQIAHFNDDNNNCEEIRFYVELQKIRNLNGLYLVEFKRLKGDIWAFKRLYHELIGKLPCARSF